MSVSRTALLERHQVLLTRDCECWGLDSPGPMRTCVACHGVGFRPKTLEELLGELGFWVLVQIPDRPHCIVVDGGEPIYADTPWMAAALAVVKNKGGDPMTTAGRRTSWSGPVVPARRRSRRTSGRTRTSVTSVTASWVVRGGTTDGVRAGGAAAQGRSPGARHGDPERAVRVQPDWSPERQRRTQEGLMADEKPLPPGTNSPADAGAVTEAPQWREAAERNQEEAKRK